MATIYNYLIFPLKGIYISTIGVCATVYLPSLDYQDYPIISHLRLDSNLLSAVCVCSCFGNVAIMIVTMVIVTMVKCIQYLQQNILLLLC